MEVVPSRPHHFEFVPFLRNSVNVIVGPTHIGKTFFVTKLLNHYKVFFPGPVSRILIILCNKEFNL